MTIKNALWATLFWIGLSLAFAGGVYAFMGEARAFEWLTAYTVEKSLSVDNLLVFGLLFTYFQVPLNQRNKMLYYGILGSVIMRGAFIGAGMGLINSFHWLYYVCGGFLLYTANKMLSAGEDDEPKFSESPVFKFLQKHKVSMFWTIIAVLEVTDIAFATDSVPAALAISDNAFIVWTSNIFAVLGLRSLYFVMEALSDKLEYLKYGVSVVLCLIGLKMLAPLVVGLSTGAWLLTIGVILGSAVLLSVYKSGQSSAVTEG